MDALILATILGGPFSLPEIHDTVCGTHPHYHVAGFNFWENKHVHIWYGEEIGE